MTRKFIWLLVASYVLLFAGIEQASAVPAYPHPITYTQSDGTRITIRIIGDEYYNYVLSSEGYTLVGGANNDYYYAKMGDNGQLTATSVTAKPISRLSATEKSVVSTLTKGIRPLTTATRLRAPQPVRSTKDIILSSVGGMSAPCRITDSETKGKLRSLIILIQFSDIKYTITNTKQVFSNMLNQQGYSDNKATGSAWDYYHSNSDGLFDPQFDVVGPYTVSGSARYYAGSAQSQYTERAGEMIKEACELAAADGVDFSIYANDEDIVRDIFVFYAGYNSAEGGAGRVWPHRSDLSDWNITLKLNGALVKGYACSSELRGSSGTQMASIGTFCHEFGHVLGWPDFYDADYDRNGLSDGMDDYSLMAGGCYNNSSRTPPSINILERWMVGWAEPEELAASQTYELGPVCDGKGALIPTRTPNEYFIAEYRGSNKVVWDRAEYLEGYSGLMVYHVDYSNAYAKRWAGDVSGGGNAVNNYADHECMKLVRSVPNSPLTPGKTFFPGEKNIKTLLPSTNILYNAWNGDVPLVNIDKIEVGTDKITLNVTRIGGPSIKFKADSYQSDAILTWVDAQSKSWLVTWSDVQGNPLGSVTTETPTLRLENLQPATTYMVSITGKTSSGEDWTQNFSISTQSRSNNNPHLGLKASEYSKDEPILLTLMDYKGTIQEVKWFIDDKQSSSTYVKLPVGEHCIKAVIIGAKTKEYLIKYITVK